MRLLHSGAVAAALSVRPTWVRQMINDGICTASRDVDHPGHWYAFGLQQIAELIVARDLRRFRTRKDAVRDITRCLQVGEEGLVLLENESHLFRLSVDTKIVTKLTKKVNNHAIIWQKRVNARRTRQPLLALALEQKFWKRSDPEGNYLKWFVYFTDSTAASGKRRRRSTRVKVTNRSQPKQGLVFLFEKNRQKRAG